MRKPSHVNIRHPDQGEKGDDIPAPIRVQEPETRNYQQDRRYVVTEAVFTSEQIEKLAPPKFSSGLALSFAVLAGFAKDFFMNDSPRDAGDGNRQNHQPQDLRRKRRHTVWMRLPAEGLGQERPI